MERVVTSVARGDAPSPSTRSVDEQWLDVLQQVCGRTAHELKGALNGVAVNLEVVRSRSSRPEAAAASVSPFASSAADQLDAVVDMSEALLKLTRAPREPVDLSETVASLTSLLAPSARVDGGSLRVELPSRELAGTTVGPAGNIVRLVIGATLLAALARKGDIRCKVHLGDEAIVHVECADAEGPLDLPSEVLTAAAASGITVHGEGQSISLAFPRAGAARTRTPERA